MQTKSEKDIHAKVHEGVRKAVESKDETTRCMLEGARVAVAAAIANGHSEETSLFRKEPIR